MKRFFIAITVFGFGVAVAGDAKGALDKDAKAASLWDQIKDDPVSRTGDTLLPLCAGIFIARAFDAVATKGIDELEEKVNKQMAERFGFHNDRKVSFQSWKTDPKIKMGHAYIFDKFCRMVPSLLVMVALRHYTNQVARDNRARATKDENKILLEIILNNLSRGYTFNTWFETAITASEGLQKIDGLRKSWPQVVELPKEEKAVVAA